jgi:hypothetical protein
MFEQVLAQCHGFICVVGPVILDFIFASKAGVEAVRWRQLCVDSKFKLMQCQGPACCCYYLRCSQDCASVVGAVVHEDVMQSDRGSFTAIPGMTILST